MDESWKTTNKDNITKEESLSMFRSMSTKDKFEYFRRFFLVPVESCDEAIRLVQSLSISHKDEVLALVKKRFEYNYDGHNRVGFIAVKRLRTTDLAIILHYECTSMGDALKYDEFDNREYGNFCYVINTVWTDFSEAGSVWFDYDGVGYKAL